MVWWMDGLAAKWSWWRDVMVGVLLARRHDGLAAAAAEGGEGGVRERQIWPARWASAAARDFDPSSDLPLCNFGPSPFLLSS